MKWCPSPARDLNTQQEGEEKGQSPLTTTVKKEASTCTMDYNPDSETAESQDGPEQV